MILILGVTASGKSRLGFELAKKIGGEIVSVDSMKVYRHMDVGTAKPSLERQKAVKHHLIDVINPDEQFSVGAFLEHSERAFEKIKANNKPIIAVGGTAMYIKAMLFGLFDGPPADDKIRDRLNLQIETEGSWPLHDMLKKVDPEAAERIHPNDKRRIVRGLEVFEITGKPISSFQRQFDQPKPRNPWKIIGLRRPKDVESGRINARVKLMVEMGLADEVKGLLEKYQLSKQAGAAIGYAEIIKHINGEIELETAIENIKVNTRRLAKGQRTWFKTFKDVEWIESEEGTTSEEILARAVEIIKNRHKGTEVPDKIIRG